MKKILFGLLCIIGSFAFADSTQYCSGKKQSCCTSPSEGFGPSWLDMECWQTHKYGYKYKPSDSCKRTCSGASKSTDTTSSSKSINTFIRCDGIDNAGNSVYAFIYPDSDIVNINGDRLNIVGQTRNGQGVVTQNFINTYGTLVYDSLVPVTQMSLSIYQFNAVTQTLLAQAFLSCKYVGKQMDSNEKTINLTDHPIFKLISKIMQKTGDLPYNKQLE